MATNNTQTPVGPTTETLKETFSSHRIPLESDFADLIDVADCGRKAVGANPAQTPGTGAGLLLDDESKLAVLPLSGGGISVSAAGVGVSLEANKGLSVGANGLAVKSGSGINLGSAGVGVTVEASKGLAVGSNGVAVVPGNGINVSATGVGVRVEASKGLTVGTNGVAVSPGNGINLSVTGVGVTVEPNKGLTVGANGVAVVPGAGITVGASGVSVENTQLFVTGMIMMFTGSVAPAGWALCDGGSGTPDLRNRFVLAGSGSDVGSKSSAIVAGAGTTKAYNVTSNSVAPQVNTSLTINSTVLTTSHIPSHRHIGGIKIRNVPPESDNMVYYGLAGANISNPLVLDPYKCTYNTGVGNAKLAYTSYEGSGQGHGHTHTISSTQSAHTHSVSIVTPYYILAFIMKL